MARNRITKHRTLCRLSAVLGQPVIYALTRGGTEHRVDALLADGRSVSLYRDGTIDSFPVGYGMIDPRDRAD